MYDTTVYGTTTSLTDAIGAIFGTYSVVMLIICVVLIVANWKMFTKAGKPGWASIVPFYSNYVMFEIAGMNGWMFLLLCVPIANIIVSIMLYLNLAKTFGKSTGFAVGLILLNPIFTLMLAFGNAKYIGTESK